MTNLFVEIGDGIEVAEKDVVQFFAGLAADAKAAISPQALIALALLAAAAAPAFAEGAAAAAQEGLNIPLDVETVQALAGCWPAFEAWTKTLKIRPAAAPPPAPVLSAALNKPMEE